MGLPYPLIVHATKLRIVPVRVRKPGAVNRRLGGQRILRMPGWSERCIS